MKLSNAVSIFFLIAIAFFIVLDLKVYSLDKVTATNIQLNKMLDNAIDDGLYNLVEVDKNNNLILNKEQAVLQFYKSLDSNLGMLSESMANDKIDLYVPVILVVDQDGFYLNYHNIYYKDDSKYVNRAWTEKIPFTYEDDDFIYSFTLDTYLYVFEKGSRKVTEGYYEDLKDIITLKDNFDDIRRHTIINAIKENMNYYINMHNRIADQFGINYYFDLPEIVDADWARTIDDISMLTVFQGYPIRLTDYTYNRYSVGSARIKKSIGYYISVSEDNQLFYHREDCDLLTNKEIKYYTPEDCAKQGAFPCMECIY